MAWQDEYLPPLITAENFSLKKLWSTIKRILFALKHSLLWHKNIQTPPKDLPEIMQDDEKLYDIAKNIYNDSIKRIEKIEEKSFKLLSYYTIILGVASYTLVESELSKPIIILTIISMLFIVWSILISFRCLNVKSIEQIYLSSIYDFEINPPSNNFDFKKTIKNFLKAAIKNDTLSNNYVDLLNAARYSLSIGVLLYLVTISLVVYNGDFLNNSSKNKEIEYLNNLDHSISNIESVFIKQNQIIKNEFEKLIISIDSLKKSRITIETEKDSL